jgi:hypothetical protein
LSEFDNTLSKNHLKIHGVHGVGAVMELKMKKSVELEW